MRCTMRMLPSARVSLIFAAARGIIAGDDAHRVRLHHAAHAGAGAGLGGGAGALQLAAFNHGHRQALGGAIRGPELRIGRQQLPFDAVDHVDPQLLIQPGHRIGLKSVDAPLGRPYVLRNAGPPGRTPDRCHDIPPQRWRRRR
ncbi:hypothetical protein G6F63_013323 [Rhizopus arrhizus]|nr:hypothetical protein G6F63_013323 [Rhizopus arrhizus]